MFFLVCVVLDHLTAIYLVTWPLNGSKAAGDLVLINPSAFVA